MTEEPAHTEEPGARELPGHIAALLARSNTDERGRPADSAGVPWSGRDLSGDGNPLHTFDGDDGRIAPAVDRARQRLLAGELSEARFVAALRGQRLFVPVMATLADEGERPDGADSVPGSGGDKQADIALVSITSASGRRTMPVFTGVEALTEWHRQARPVAAESGRIMLAALGEGADLAVLDPGSRLSFVLRRPAMTALAQGSPWTPSYEDREVASALEEVVDQSPGVRRLIVRPGRGVGTTTSDGVAVAGGGSGPELMIAVVPEPGLDETDRKIAAASVRTCVAELELLRRRADSVEIVLTDPD
ncbi:SseB family protein [Nesterenkonia marinintestina]|uniref:SseB family protein n=1 Tax=Nesterenkonia marinintestina TaxID=2979865 RepID=UPI0021C09751|nr:SseB family protein [Nesterenkonia sp. GX14115]